MLLEESIKWLVFFKKNEALLRMFKKLQHKWKVNGWRLILILLGFTIGGSLCGWLGRKILLLTGMEKGVWWVIAYIILVTLLWPPCVLLVSVFLGQFSFFKKYISKIFNRIGGRKEKMGEPVNIAIFASGAGSNAARIIEYFCGNAAIKISLIASNVPAAGVLTIAARNNIDTLLINRENFFKADAYLPVLEKYKISWIVLAGFLWKIPSKLIAAYPQRIINIHPALLPGHGGKGMYGHFVHEAVITNGDTESGISIHFVDELYDHGKIIFQAKCPVDKNDTADSLAKKVQQLEHTYFAPEIQKLILQNCS